MKKILYAVLILPLILTACYHNELPKGAGEMEFIYDFSQGDHGWQAGYSDYPPDNADIFHLEFGLRELPTELDRPGTGFYIQGYNASDDLFMFLKKRLDRADGIEPNKVYQLFMTIDLTSNAPTGCAGIGGPPGEGVTLKAGGSGIEPLPVPAANDHVRMNIDKGEQVQGGMDANVVGDIANGIPCDEALNSGEPYASLIKPYVHPTPLTSNDQGELWIIVGTDSGFEGLTGLYYERINVGLTPSK